MCGVVGLIGTPDAAREAFLGLTTLQHRGQDAAGILSYDTDGFHRVKNLGLVDSVFTRENISTLTGNLAIGHARYATIGRGDLGDVQPFLISYPFGIGMAHNGNIVNVGELADDLKVRARRHLLTHSDTEVVLNFFAEGLSKAPPSQPGESELQFEAICSSVGEIYKRVNGSYSIVTLIADQGLVAFRDPNGIRPLVWGSRKTETGRAHMIASESVALNFLGYEIERDIAPGEVVFIDQQGKVFSRVLPISEDAGQRPHRPCMFEWIYFASPESIIDKVPVYGARIGLGKYLGRSIRKLIAERGIEADIIVPVPETSRIAAIALAEELGIPYREVLIKNRYIKRTFILDSQEKRQKAVNLKLSPVRSEIQGKRVLLVDDSIVRGTTSKKIIELVRQAGASKVYFVSTCPPIKNPCYYGIDFPNGSELIAAGRDLAQIEKELGADAVIYQDIEGLQAAIREASSEATGGIQNATPCMACLDGKYPSDISAGARFAASRAQDRKQPNPNASPGSIPAMQSPGATGPKEN
ncbi:MAG: amidophosphoribosyltransferase [Methylotenera sp.]|nr:amidophosphoribosyltransferase [Oligoflexia bacterium]